MRDSALKHRPVSCTHRPPCRVGEELMRDSALKPAISAASSSRSHRSEKSSCATAL